MEQQAHMLQHAATVILNILHLQLETQTKLETHGCSNIAIEILYSEKICFWLGLGFPGVTT